MLHGVAWQYHPPSSNGFLACQPLLQAASVPSMPLLPLACMPFPYSSIRQQAYPTPVGFKRLKATADVEVMFALIGCVRRRHQAAPRLP
jgi:hypothetical protein